MLVIHMGMKHTVAGGGLQHKRRGRAEAQSPFALAGQEEKRRAETEAVMGEWKAIYWASLG